MTNEKMTKNWQYIVQNKCPCWFWHNEKSRCIRFLVAVYDEEDGEVYIDDWNQKWEHCCPVKKEDLVFYEDVESK